LEKLKKKLEKIFCWNFFLKNKTENQFSPLAGKNMQCKVAGQGCRARLPSKVAKQGCQARLPGKSTWQVDVVHFSKYSFSKISKNSNRFFEPTLQNNEV
jgi:hypothetical protein